MISMHTLLCQFTQGHYHPETIYDPAGHGLGDRSCADISEQGQKVLYLDLIMVLASYAS
jgi:hypothetical protein